MKICMITECFAGGVLTYLRNICNYMDENGQEVIIIYSRKKETPENLKGLFNKNVKLIEIPFNRKSPIAYINLYKSYKELLEKINPEVVHFHSSFSGYIGRILLKLNKNFIKKSYYTPHGYAFLKLNSNKAFRKFFFYMEKFVTLINPRTIIVPISDSEENAAKKITKEKNIKKVLTGIDTNQLDSIISDLNRYNNKAIHIVSTGRLSDQKNPLMFIEIAKKCKSLNLNVKFTWIGGGELEGVVREKIKEYGLMDYVNITGWLEHQEAIKYMYQYGDIYLQTSLWEGLPLTVLEAMYLKLCVFVNNAPGNVDPIENNINGCILNEVNEFVYKISEIIKDENMLNEFGEKANETTKLKFDILLNTQKLLDVY
ncbi:glycosyltransferase [Niallia circulans]|uniref:glycosyltransferase n=1 Tax=Niallia circulans TaxID=1397 RepID=UPI003D97AB1D